MVELANLDPVWRSALTLARFGMPIALAGLANAAAEALWGDREPMIQSMLGFAVGIVVGFVISDLASTFARRGWSRAAKGVVTVAVVFTVLAIPIGQILIRIAYSYPDYRIPW